MSTPPYEPPRQQPQPPEPVEPRAPGPAIQPKPPTIATPNVQTPYAPVTPPTEPTATPGAPVAPPATPAAPSSTPTPAIASPATPTSTPTPRLAPTSTPTTPTGVVYRPTLSDDATTVLAPVTAPTNILDRIPLPERKRWKLITTVLGSLLVVFLGFSIYLWSVNAQWQKRSDALTSEAYDLGDRLATTRDQVVSQQEQLDLLAEQLTTSQQRVIDMADEIASAGDAAAYAQQQLSWAQALAETGGATAIALNRCVNEQKKLVGYLKNPDAWDPASLAAFESTVNTICSYAQDANEILQKELTE